MVISLKFGDRRSQANYSKFNTSVLETRDFQEWPEKVIKQALVEMVIGNS